jgi:hypothetical protein
MQAANLAVGAVIILIFFNSIGRPVTAFGWLGCFLFLALCYYDVVLVMAAIAIFIMLELEITSRTAKSLRKGGNSMMESLDSLEKVVSNKDSVNLEELEESILSSITKYTATIKELKEALKYVQVLRKLKG